ncbi:MAG: hypothetical protein MZW92_72780 [Comamonadaceae bacterium]|nr:hypothetical protein [Comamonadaceae bacterium]
MMERAAAASRSSASACWCSRRSDERRVPPYLRPQQPRRADARRSALALRCVHLRCWSALLCLRRALAEPRRAGAVEVELWRSRRPPLAEPRPAPPPAGRQPPHRRPEPEAGARAEAGAEAPLKPEQKAPPKVGAARSRRRLRRSRNRRRSERKPRSRSRSAEASEDRPRRSEARAQASAAERSGSEADAGAGRGRVPAGHQAAAPAAGGSAARARRAATRRSDRADPARASMFATGTAPAKHPRRTSEVDCCSTARSAVGDSTCSGLPGYDAGRRARNPTRQPGPRCAIERAHPTHRARRRMPDERDRSVEPRPESCAVARCV